MHYFSSLSRKGNQKKKRKKVEWNENTKRNRWHISPSHSSKVVLKDPSTHGETNVVPCKFSLSKGFGKTLLTSTWKRGPIFDLLRRIQEKATGCFLLYSTNVLRFCMLVGCIVWYLNNAGLCWCFLERYLLLRLMSLVFIYIYAIHII